MAKQIKSVRGMHDVLPDNVALWQQIEAVVRTVVHAYGYCEIRLPVVEREELFRRSIGEVTDIVSKEMYTFTDRSGDSLTLRPEGTAGCVRAGIQAGLFYHQVRRLWYSGSMFRHERPQQGRLREFHQVGVEAFGLPGPDIDVELILLSRQILQGLGLIDTVALEINSIGMPAERMVYRQTLVAYLSAHMQTLDNDSKHRLTENPLRILDSKNPEMATVIENAPRLWDYLSPASKEHFEWLCAVLDDAGLNYRINYQLVRGLDYYSNTVFEWITDRLGSQGAVCAGGRYDGLVEQLGGHATPAIGFAMGIERLVALLIDVGSQVESGNPHVYLILLGAKAERHGLLLAEHWRRNIPALRLLTHCGGGSIKGQFKQADKSGAQWALILGDDEVEQDLVSIKPLRDNGEQQSIRQADLGQWFAVAGCGKTR